MATKSLKGFFRESAIKNEVKKWSIEECKDYIDRHKKDSSQSSLLKKKIAIVSKISKIKQAVDENGENRKKLLEKISINELMDFAPKEAQDPKNNNLRSYQKNTGIFLWKRGYNPKKFLGNGANGVVWECNGKAMKVTCNRNFGCITIVNATKTEANEIKKVGAILEKAEKNGDKNGSEKIKKYLSIIEDKTGKKKIGKKRIFEAELAPEGNLISHRNRKSKFDIDTIIRMGKQALKALKIIHDAGYSHNDVKPDNLLVVERDSKKVKDLKKTGIKLSDFGGMTEIKNNSKTYISNSFCAPDMYKTNPEAVGKRDVYSLGLTLIFLLIKGENHRKIAKELTSKGAEYVYKKYDLEKIYCIGNGNKINDKNIEKVMNLLITIQTMVQENYTKRIEIDEALTKIKRIPS